mgnify:CR=1 FL=1
MKKVVGIIFLSLTLLACGGSSDEGSDQLNTEEQAKLAQDYVDEILQIMKNHAVTRYQVNWGELEAEVHTLAANAKNIQGTYRAIIKALELLGTNHSWVRSSDGQVVAYHSDIVCSQDFEINRPQDENIGYLRVDGFVSSSELGAKNFATNIQAEIAAQDSASLDGWIVDLRDNGGGNMWPMIAGIGPLLGDGLYGHFVDADEQVVRWGYENGASYIEDMDVVTVDEPYSLLNPQPKIAVLSSARVGSSGEATLIAFKKHFNVRIFGTDSCGVSTSNEVFPLSDGGQLVLTTAIMADRELQKYGGRVSVDQSEEQANVVNKAIAWIKN